MVTSVTVIESPPDLHEQLKSANTLIKNLIRERDAARELAKNEIANAEMYARAWVRSLGGKLYNKRHHIDACVVTTERMVARLAFLEKERRERIHAAEIAEYGPLLTKSTWET